MAFPKSTTGTLDFSVPAANKPCQTWYQIFGTLSSSVVPLVVLHGGPGVPFRYVLPISDLSKAPHNVPVIFYDQIGCGNSTHLPEKNGDRDFWTVQLFLDELDNVLAQLGVKGEYDLLGHSWGGMLAAEHAVRQPKGLRKLIISCSPASMRLWVQAAGKLRKELPQDVQDVLDRCEKEGTTDGKDYEEAEGLYYQRHLCRVHPFPPELEESFKLMKEDPTVFMTMNGPSEFFVTGSLKEWDVEKELHKIEVKTLLINGHYDEAQDETMEPFAKLIPDVKWEKFSESSHTPLWEERQKFMDVVGGFLKD